MKRKIGRRMVLIVMTLEEISCWRIKECGVQGKSTVRISIKYMKIRSCFCKWNPGAIIYFWDS